jgi:lipooligosaccharide transport system ATP-binding protein
MTEAAIEAERLTKRYGSKMAVDGIDLRVERGTCVGIVGRNGAGKSTTMRMLTTVTRPTSGGLRILGLNSVSEARRIKSRLGVVTQTNNLDEDLTVTQNLEIYCRYFRMGRRQSRRVAAAAIEGARLSGKSDAPVSTLSGGMKRRLTIARAMVNDPEILLLDEPTAALDAQSKHNIWSTLGQLRSEGRTILIMSHDMEEVEMLCDLVFIMETGRFVVSGAPHELIERYCHPALLDIVVEDALSHDWARLLADELSEPRETARGIVVEVQDPVASMERLRTSSIEFTSATVRPSSLTDVFLRVTGREAD